MSCNWKLQDFSGVTCRDSVSLMNTFLSGIVQYKNMTRITTICMLSLAVAKPRAFCTGYNLVLNKINSTVLLLGCNAVWSAKHQPMFGGT
jgi:ammonia channel protein AmtB